MASSVLHTQQQLPHGSNFSDAFWDGQNKGVEIIMSRLRKSKDTCEEIKRLYELRASIEQDYGERLLKLAQSSRVGDFEEDSFAETLSRIPSALETTARAHIDLAQQLKDHLEAPLDGFLKDQRDVRKMQQQQIENSKQLKNLHEADVARAREYYSIECTKLISLEQYYYSLDLNESSSNNKDEVIKIEKEIEEQRRMIAVADQVYRRSVDNYNSVNERWINDWTTSADKFQEMEVKRISYLRSTLWSFANMMTSTFSIDEECCDRIRTALEITDVQKDIRGFVQRYGTGTRIPAPLSYEVLYQSNPVIPLTKQSSSSISIVPEIVAVGAASSATSAISNHNESSNDTIDHQQSLSAPIPQTSADSLPEDATRGASESNAALKSLPPQPVTILTNPDEELKSVDRQLQQLEVLNTSPHSEEGSGKPALLMQASPQQLTPNHAEAMNHVIEEKQAEENKVEEPLSGVTNTTDQSTGPVSTAIKEVEQILNQKSFDDIIAASTASQQPQGQQSENEVPKTRNVVSSRASYASNNQTIPPIMMARSIYSDVPAPVSEKNNATNAEADDFSAGIYDALGIKHTSQYDSKNDLSTNNNINADTTTTAALAAPPVQLAPLSSSETTSILKSSGSLNNNVKSDSNNSSPQPASKYKPMPNPVYNNNGSSASGQLSTETTVESKQVNNGTNEMANATPETVPNQRPVVGVRTSSLMLSNTRRQESHDSNKSSSLNQRVKQDDDDDEEESEEDKEYHNRMPRPPPKDEKWVISSIRRPQQLPVRTLNARMFDGTVSRNSMVDAAAPVTENSPQQQQVTSPENFTATPVGATAENEGEQHRQPKVHRPAIPLTIDIPNSVKPTPELPQNAAQQVIAEGRRVSQMSPIQQKMDLSQQQQQQQQQVDRNLMRGYISQQKNGGGMEDGGIRPAPWQEEMSAEDRIAKNFRGTPVMASAAAGNTNSYYGNGHHHSYQPGMPGPRGSSLKLSNNTSADHQMQLQQQQHQHMLLQQQQQQFEEENKKKFGKNNNGKSYNESSVKSAKEGKGGRFSLGFFTGNKKEKKKEKEAAAAAAAAASANSVPYSQTPTPDQQQQYMAKQQQQYMMQQQQRPASQQVMYQQELSQSDLKSNNSINNNHSDAPTPQQQQTQPATAAPASQPFEGSRFIGYAKAQWPFEATIDGEMSFHEAEVLGVIRKQTDGWWEAERLEPAVAGQRGLVPGNYMIEATHPSP